MASDTLTAKLVTMCLLGGISLFLGLIPIKISKGRNKLGFLINVNVIPFHYKLLQVFIYSAILGLQLAEVAVVADDPDVLRRRRHPDHDGDAHDARGLPLHPIQHRARNSGIQT